MQYFVSILETSLPQSTTFLGQLLINQSNKSPVKEDEAVTGKSRKRAKTYIERAGDEPTISKGDGPTISGQDEGDGEDTTVTRAYAVSENDEDDYASISDQDQVCHDMTEPLQSQHAGNDKVDQQQNAFLDGICQIFKKKQEEGLSLTNNKLTDIIN